MLVDGRNSSYRNLESQESVVSEQNGLPPLQGLFSCRTVWRSFCESLYLISAKIAVGWEN